MYTPTHEHAHTRTYTSSRRQPLPPLPPAAGQSWPPAWITAAQSPAAVPIARETPSVVGLRFSRPESQPDLDIPIGPPSSRIIVRGDAITPQLVGWNSIPDGAAEYHVIGNLWRDIPEHWKKPRLDHP